MSTTSVPVPASTPVPPTLESSFLRHRLGSFLAVAPLGVWTVWHLWQNLTVFQGPAAWQEAVTGHQHPVSTFVTSVVVLLPLLLHTLWGIARLMTSRPNNPHYNNYGNLKYLLQRVSALGVLLFLGAHIWLAYVHPRLFEGHPELFHEFADEMRHNLPTLPVYLLGTLGVAYHLGNGIANIGMGWGLAQSARGLKRFEWLAIATFLVTLAMAWGAVYGIWRAGEVM